VAERRTECMALLGYAAAATAAVWILEPTGVAGLLVAPLLIVCPGYASARAIEGEHRIEPFAFGATVLALSFATAALGGVVLNAFNVGLTPRAWSSLLLIVTAVAVVVALTRGVPPLARWDPPRVSVFQGLAILATVLLLGAAAAVAYRSQQALDKRTSRTTLSVTPSTDGSAIDIAVRNADSAPGRYRVRIASGGRATAFSLSLDPSEHWSGTAALASAEGPVRVQLFSAADNESPLRTVRLR
jgi:hypothetical protein